MKDYSKNWSSQIFIDGKISFTFETELHELYNKRIFFMFSQYFSPVAGFFKSDFVKNTTIIYYCQYHNF